MSKAEMNRWPRRGWEFLAAALAVIAVDAVYIENGGSVPLWDNVMAWTDRIAAMHRHTDAMPPATSEQTQIKFQFSRSPFLASKATNYWMRFHPFIDVAGASYLKGGVPVDANDYFGFRNSFNAYVKSNKYHYIVISGNSEAVGYRHTTTIAENLERILNERAGKSYRVVNLAMNSATTAQEINYFVNLGFNLHPEFVISHSFAMDFFYGMHVAPEFKYMGLFYTHEQLTWSRLIHAGDFDDIALSDAWARSPPELYLLDGYLRNVYRYRKIAEASGAHFILGLQKFNPSGQQDAVTASRWNLVGSFYRQINDALTREEPDLSIIDFNKVDGLAMAAPDDPIHTTDDSARRIAEVYADMILAIQRPRASGR